MGLFGNRYKYAEDIRDAILYGDSVEHKKVAKFIDKKLDKMGGGFRALDLTVLEALLILKGGIKFDTLEAKIYRIRQDLMVPILKQIDGEVGSTFLVDVMLHGLEELRILFEETNGQNSESTSTLALLLAYFYSDTDIKTAKFFLDIGKINEVQYCIEKIEKCIAERDIFK